MAKGEAAEVRLEDSSTGELFAMCPFTPATQAVAIEAAVDSSRCGQPQQGPADTACPLIECDSVSPDAAWFACLESHA